MKNNFRTAVLAVMLASGFAIADDVEIKKEIKIVVDSDGDTVEWVSSGTDLDLDSMAVGETRTIENEAGEPITVTRTEDGMSFDIDGEAVTIPDLEVDGPHMAFVGHGGSHEDIDVRVIRMEGDGADMEFVGHDAVAIHAHHPEGITIISGSPLDDSVRESIRSVLISAGHDDEVRFIDNSGHGEQRTRVIEKKVIVQ